MKKFKLILLILTVSMLMVSCKKTGSGNCESGTLYYLPNCATIKGYITFDNGNAIKVFRHTVASQYQGSGIRVCVTYTNDPNQLFTTDCIGHDPIILTSIESE